MLIVFRRMAYYALLLFVALMRHADAHPLHTDVLVFVPAYEGCELFDDSLKAHPTCVWGNVNTFLSSDRYFALRLPNPLEARTMRAVGPLDVYGHFLDAMTHADSAAAAFVPYTEGADFFVFDYDWRQDMATSSAPMLARALDRYAQIHAAKTGLPAQKTRFILVAHSMGGLVARTMLSQQPAWAPRVKRLYLVGTPNAGSVKAIKTVAYGPDSLKSHATGFPGVLLNLVPTNVDQNVTKLTGITRPSLYELLPTGDPHWTRGFDDRSEPVADAYATEPYRRYWPSAALEKRLFVEGWLKPREAEGRKHIEERNWIFCRGDSALVRLMAVARHWRQEMGTLQHTSELLTDAGGATRLRLVAGTGLSTPYGVVTTGEHDQSHGDYPLNTNAGDGTVELSRMLEGTPENAPNVKLLRGVTHGKLMGSAELIAFLRSELR